MRLVIHQDFPAHGPDDVAAAYADPGLYAAMADLPFVGTPSLVDHTSAGGVVQLAVRWAVRVDLPAAARLFVDESRLSFVEHTQIGADRRASFRIDPDHYPRLLAFAGTYDIAPGAVSGTRRTVTGDLRVQLGWKGRLVEAEVTRVIASGLRDALGAQVAAVERYLT